MADGLLATRQERLTAYWAKFGLAVAPSGALAVAAALLDAPAVGIAISVVAVLAAFVTGQSARTRVGALVAGLVVAALLFLLQLVLAWLITHPVVQP